MSDVVLPEELKKEMHRFPRINWSAVAREAIERKIEALKKSDRLLAKSKMTEEDAIALGRKISRKLGNAYEG